MVELASYINSHLESQGIFVTVSGGSAVQIYSNGLYTSKDIDMVDMYDESSNKIKKAMEEIGFIQEAKIKKYFKHPDSEYYIEFPLGPLGVGDEDISIEQTKTIKTEYGVVRILSATDSLKDRLSGYIFFKDKQNLAQAKDIIKVQKDNIDFDDLERWLKNEKREDIMGLLLEDR